jgi:hypothetical protein
LKAAGNGGVFVGFSFFLVYGHERDREEGEQLVKNGRG